MTSDAFTQEVPFYETQAVGPAAFRKERYLGSVRFCKHLILTGMLSLILIPTVLAIVFAVQLQRTRKETQQLRQQIDRLQAAAAQRQPDEPDDEVPTQQAVVTQQTDAGSGPEIPAYQNLYPELYAEPVARNSIDVEKTVYLTFDDGPSERTPELLEVLEAYDVKATFFVLGGESEEVRQWMRDIVEAGHTIGVHSYSHSYADIYSSVEAFLEDFAKEYELIKEATGVAPQVFRFPGGSINVYNGHIYQEIISEMTRRGFVYFDWNRQTGDAVQSEVTVQQLVDNALDRVGSMRRVFLLAHDAARFYNVVEALPMIIEGYQAEGFTFAALTPEVKPVIYNYLA